MNTIKKHSGDLTIVVNELSKRLGSIYPLSKALDVCQVRVAPWGSSELEVQLLKDKWLQLTKALRIKNMNIHVLYDNESMAGIPWQEQLFTCTFVYKSVEYMCLMSGQELINDKVEVPG